MQLRKRARAATVEDSMEIDTALTIEIKEDSTESKENEKDDKENDDVILMEIDDAASPDLPRCNASERNLDPDEEYSNVTVKVGFKKAIRGIELASAIENYVRTMNSVRIPGSRIVLKYVLDKVQRGLPVGNLQSSEGGIMRQLFVGAFHYFHKGIGAGLDNEDIALSIHEYVMLAKIRQCDLPSIEG
ncbi:hypothetical protein MP638_000941 [Amoeboaphelidium occidentale]|nr:hypothetical protein MP638_000941 [Amoeboaphelidium occidentale]